MYVKKDKDITESKEQWQNLYLKSLRWKSLEFRELKEKFTFRTSLLPVLPLLEVLSHFFWANVRRRNSFDHSSPKIVHLSVFTN